MHPSGQPLSPGFRGGGGVGGGGGVEIECYFLTPLVLEMRVGKLNILILYVIGFPALLLPTCDTCCNRTSDPPLWRVYEVKKGYSMAHATSVDPSVQ